MPDRNLDAGGDGVSGEVGDRASRVALGKDIQQMIVALNDSGIRPESDTWHKLIEIVLGDGVKWNGVMQELERLDQRLINLTTEVTTLKTEVKTLRNEMDQRKETSREMLWMLRLVLAGVSVLAVAYVWGAFHVAGG